MNDRTGVLQKSPLVYTLASIRFAPWPLLAKKIDEIQDKLREITPITHKVEIQLATPDGKEQISNSSWILLSTDRTLGITLTQDQLLVFSTKYIHYDDFNTKLDKALTALLEQMRFIDVTQMGMRYIDCIEIKPGQQFKDYVTPQLLPAQIGSYKVIGGATITTYELDHGKLQVRCVTQPDQFTIPVDLIQLHAIVHGPTNSLKLNRLDGNKLLLDMDANNIYSAPERMTEKKQILGLLRTLHSNANEFFRNKDVCTDLAFKVWKGE